MTGREESIAAIICAAGSSTRMDGKKKEFESLPSDGSRKDIQSVLGASVSAFASLPEISPIVIVLPEHEKEEDRARFSGAIMEELRLIDPLCNPASIGKMPGEEPRRILFARGGASRRISVHNALSFLETFNPSYALIHDGARPWINESLVRRVIAAMRQYGAAIPGLPLIETPKELEGPLAQGREEEAVNFIKRHLRRADICAAQTPQGFRFKEILRAHEMAAVREKKEAFEYTDDAEVWAEFIGKVAVIPGDVENRKITYLADLGKAK